MPQPLTAPAPAPTSGATPSPQAGAAPAREDRVFPKALGQAQRAQEPVARPERPASSRDTEEAPRAEGPAGPRPVRPSAEQPAKAESGKEPPGDPVDAEETPEAAATQAGAQAASATVAAAAVALMQSLAAPTEPSAATLVEPIRSLPAVLPTEGAVRLGETPELSTDTQTPILPQALPGTPTSARAADAEGPLGAVAAQVPALPAAGPAFASSTAASVAGPGEAAGAPAGAPEPAPPAAGTTSATPVAQSAVQAVSTLVVEAPAAPHAAVATAAVRAQLKPEDPAPSTPVSTREDLPLAPREGGPVAPRVSPSDETAPQGQAPAGASGKSAAPAPATLSAVSAESKPASVAAPGAAPAPKAAEPEKEAKPATVAEAPAIPTRTHGAEKPAEPSQPGPILTRPAEVTVQVHAGPGTPVQGPVTTLPVPPAPEARPMPHVAWQEAQQVGAQVDGSIKWILRQQGGAAELQLHPENLGKVVIQLKVEGQEVHAKVWASEAGTLPLIQEHRASLEIGLQQQGLSLGSFDLQHGAQHGRFDQETQASRAAFLKQIEPEGRGVQQEMPVLGRFLSRNAGQVEVYA